MRHLYLKLYLAFLAIVVAGVCAVGVAWHLWGEPNDEHRGLAYGVAELVLANLPPADDPAFPAAFKASAAKLTLDLALYSPDRELLISSTQEPLPFPERRHDGFFKTREAAGLCFQLADGRWFAAVFPRPTAHRRFLLMLGQFAGLVALGCYPLARQITRRIERLKSSVEAFGKGSLATRAKVEGRDEVAELSKSFNATAEKIETLVGQQKRMLASASHELRSPLARLRMALALIETAEPARRAELIEETSKDIEELDALVEDLLLTVRAEAKTPADERVEFLSLVQEEAERHGAAVSGEAVTVRGHRSTLKRLVRNLLENAVRHGQGKNVSVTVRRQGQTVQLVVEDDGPGVPAGESERIFEPFYRLANEQRGDRPETTRAGVGLGLALVRQIAMQHGGRAWYENREPSGSRFIVEIAL